MEKGDLFLTPSGLWHEHGHAGKGPVIWLDALDLPIVRALEASYAVEDESGRSLSRPAEIENSLLFSLPVLMETDINRIIRRFSAAALRDSDGARDRHPSKFPPKGGMVNTYNAAPNFVANSKGANGVKRTSTGPPNRTEQFAGFYASEYAINLEV